MGIRLKDLAGLLAGTTRESMEVYDEEQTRASPVLVVQVPYDGSLELYDHLEKLTNAAKEYYNEKEESSVD